MTKLQLKPTIFNPKLTIINQKYKMMIVKNKKIKIYEILQSKKRIYITK